MTILAPLIVWLICHIYKKILICMSFNVHQITERQTHKALWKKEKKGKNTSAMKIKIYGSLNLYYMRSEAIHHRTAYGKSFRIYGTLKFILIFPVFCVNLQSVHAFKYSIYIESCGWERKKNQQQSRKRISKIVSFMIRRDD